MQIHRIDQIECHLLLTSLGAFGLTQPITVTALSSELALSPKTLGRRIEAATGVSPIKFIQRRRLSHAVHLLETTALSIETVAAQVGYQDSTALRKLIKREFGVTPSTLR